MSLDFKSIDLSSDALTVQNLLKRAFPDVDGQTEFSIEVLNWKYRKASGDGTCFIGSIGHEPVSFYGVLARNYISGEEMKTVGLVVDVLSVPELQGKGIFTQTGTHTLKCLEQTRVTSVIGFPIRPEVLPGHLKIGWKIKFKLPVYFYPIGKSEPKSFREYLSKILILSWGYALKVLRPRRGIRADLLTVDDFVVDCDVLNFYRSQNHDGSVILEKNYDFLNWRLKRPYVNYMCFTLRDQGIVAIAICRVMNIKGLKTLVVVDIDARTARYSKKLADAIIDCAIQEKVSLISFCTTKSNIKRLGLLHLGFIRSHLHFKVITRDINDSAVDFTEINSRITWLDSDTV